MLVSWDVCKESEEGAGRGFRGFERSLDRQHVAQKGELVVFQLEEVGLFTKGLTDELEIVVCRGVRLHGVRAGIFVGHVVAAGSRDVAQHVSEHAIGASQDQLVYVISNLWGEI